MKTTIIWASRHEMSSEQYKALGNVDVRWYNQQSIDVDNLLEFADRESADAIAIVAPLEMIQELQSKTTLPILRARTRREFDADGSKRPFVFDGWEQVVDVNIETTQYMGDGIFTHKWSYLLVD